MSRYWPTHVDIDLSIITHNVEQIKTRIGKEVCLMAILKADAYGHGAYETAKAALKGGAEKFGVASIDEAIELRDRGITDPILILGLSPTEAIGDIVGYGLIQTISDMEFAKLLSDEAVKQKKTAEINIKVNTGMNRLGINHDEAADYVENISKLPNISIEGIYTHFATAYNEIEYTEYQFKLFEGVLDKLKVRGIHIPYKHCCGSGGILNFPEMYLNQVRAGVIITTPYEAIDSSMSLDLRESFSFKSKIIFLRWVKAGDYLGYNRMYTVERDSTVAVVSAGWGDGIPRELSNKGYVLIRGKRCPIRGRVCSDNIIVDVSSVEDVCVGDEVVIIGEQGENRISAWEWGKILGGVSSPVTLRTLVTQRVQKKYI